MTLSAIFDEQSILLNLDGKTKEMVFAELIEAITEVHSEFDMKQLGAVIDEREQKMSTGIGSGAAIPHGNYPGVSKAAGAIGVSRTGIDYGSLDNQPVYVVFMIVMGGVCSEQHLRILNQVFTLVNSEALDQIRAAKNAPEVRAILARFP
jgi:mannitol/fructose-specific phosphotransferase system IIA component (Ntr-type)